MESHRLTGRSTSAELLLYPLFSFITPVIVYCISLLITLVILLIWLVFTLGTSDPPSPIRQVLKWYSFGTVLVLNAIGYLLAIVGRGLYIGLYDSTGVDFDLQLNMASTFFSTLVELLLFAIISIVFTCHLAKSRDISIRKSLIANGVSVAILTIMFIATYAVWANAAVTSMGNLVPGSSSEIGPSRSLCAADAFLQFVAAIVASVFILRLGFGYQNGSQAFSSAGRVWLLIMLLAWTLLPFFRFIAMVYGAAVPYQRNMGMAITMMVLECTALIITLFSLLFTIRCCVPARESTTIPHNAEHVVLDDKSIYAPAFGRSPQEMPAKPFSPREMPADMTSPREMPADAAAYSQKKVYEQPAGYGQVYDQAYLQGYQQAIMAQQRGHSPVPVYEMGTPKTPNPAAIAPVQDSGEARSMIESYDTN